VHLFDAFGLMPSLIYKTKILIKLQKPKEIRRIYSLIFSLRIMFFLISFVSKRKHLLATLLSLEGLLFILFGLLYLSRVNQHRIWPLLMVFLTLTVCEGAIGLRILVCIVRSTGTDNLRSLNFIQS